MTNYPTYKLGDVAEILDSFRKPINSTERAKRIQGKSENELYPYYGATGQVGLIDEYLVDGEYVLVGEDGAPFLEPFKNKSYIIKGKAWVNNHAHIISGKKGVSCNQYLNYFLNSFDYKDYVNGTTRLKLTQGNLVEIPIPLPPLPTQHQIVSRIEALFAELDKAVEHLRAAQQQLKTYRQAVLRDAFEGCKELKTVFELSTVVTSGSRGWAKYYTDKEDARFVRITDLTRDNIILQNKNIQYISLPPNAEGKRSLLQPNDVLVSITADLGSIALVPQNIGEAYINQHIAMIRFKNTKLGKFMAYYLKSDFGQRELLKNKRGNGKLGLGLDDIRNTYIPSVAEEKASEIVNKIESCLSQAEAAEARIAESLQKTETLRQSILKKAFEGELGKIVLS